MDLNDEVYVLTTYRTPEDHYAFAIDSSHTKWDASMADPESFRDGLAFIVSELSRRGDVIVRRDGSVPLELIPEPYR